jgi:amidase
MARRVRDLALLLNVIAAVDPADPRTEDPAERAADYTAGLEDASLAGARLGVVVAYAGGNREVDRTFAAALDLLRAQGAELVDVVLPDAVLDGRAQILERLIETENRDQVNAYLLHTEQGMPHSLAELLRMGQSPLIAGSATPVHPGRLGAYRRALESPGLADLDYLHILSERLPAARGLVRALLREHALDAFVVPTMLCPASSLLDDFDSSYDCDADDPLQPAYLASIANLPELTLPMGWTGQGLPLGLSLVGTPFGEARLLALGQAFEAVAGARRPPDLPDAPPAPETLPGGDG